MINRLLRLFLGLFPILFLPGCWYYSTSDSLPPNLKTIHIRTVENKTAQFDLSEMLTNRITQAFIDNGRLKLINDPDQADLILQVQVIQYDNKPYTFGQQEEVREYRVTLSLNVTCKNVKENNNLWSRSGLSDFTNYNHQEENEDRAIQETVKKLSEELVNNTLTVW
ncbi:MAG: LptE family protein [Candidatus Delongbacteria bacterium]|nr:LptE family protein [Candidatus Delongbacteria bacterium]